MIVFGVWCSKANRRGKSKQTGCERRGENRAGEVGCTAQGRPAVDPVNNCLPGPQLLCTASVACCLVLLLLLLCYVGPTEVRPPVLAVVSYSLSCEIVLLTYECVSGVYVEVFMQYVR